jgi:hypothetical protein
MTEQNETLTEYITANKEILISKPFANHPTTIGGYINVGQSTKNLMECSDILDKFNIKYVPLWGTLLGMYRDGALIAHDTDVDVSIVLDEGDESKLIAALPSFEKAGLLLTRYWREVILSLTRGGDYIDLYLHRDAGGRKFQGPSYTLTDPDFSGENTIKFQGKSFCMIQDPEAFFRKFYGSDWKTPIKDLHGSPANETR